MAATPEKSRGRIESRTCAVLRTADGLNNARAYLGAPRLPGLAAVARVEATVETSGAPAARSNTAGRPAVECGDAWSQVPQPRSSACARDRRERALVAGRTSLPDSCRAGACEG